MAMDVPAEYRGREQSYLKHRVLAEYLDAWGRKIGSLSRKGRLRLWYVDCFAGPWKSQQEDLGDTSIDIGLRALESAAATWEEKGHEIELAAVFVEKDDRAFADLQSYLAGRQGRVRTIARHGEFGEHLAEIQSRLGEDPAFIFVDPTGFKGVDMRYIAALANHRMRDVMVNVMFNHINRFKDDPREFLRQQMRDFFGLVEDDLPEGLPEPELLRLYRCNLKSWCQAKYAADLAIPHPTKERTWFHLVVGGNHRAVLELFREVERRVIGREAAPIRQSAKGRAAEDRTGQLSFDQTPPGFSPVHDRWYKKKNDADRRDVIEALRRRASKEGRTQFENLWPELLEEFHVTRSELAQLVVAEATEGRLVIEPERPRRKAVKDEEWLSMVR